MAVEIAPDVVPKLMSAIAEAAPIWRSIPPSDMKIVTKRVSKAESSHRIVSYRGARSFLPFRKEIEEHKKLKDIGREICELDGQLSALMISGAGIARRLEFNDLLEVLMMETEKREAVTPGTAISDVVNEFREFLRNPRFEASIFAPLSGAFAEDNVSIRTPLPGNAMIRRVTDIEIEELFSRDVFQATGTPIFGLPELALEVTRERILSVGTSESVSSEDAKKLQEMQDAIDWACSVLHCFKEGSVSISRRYLRMGHWLPQCVLGGMSWQFPGASLIGPVYQFVAGDAEALTAFAERIHMSPLRCIPVVVDRLHLAAQRTKISDSIVDVCIGFEALLGASRDQPISETLAMRYAFLGAPEDRLRRHKAMKKLYGYRSAIVHGTQARKSYDLGAGEIDLSTLKSQAIAMLRGLLQDVVRRPDLSALTSIPDEFWLSLILGRSDLSTAPPAAAT